MKKRLNFLFLFLLILSPALFGTIAIAAEEPDVEDDLENVVLSSNLIRNFKFDKFNSTSLNDAADCYNGKLKFEMLPKWELKKENVELINKYVVGDKLYLKYQVALTNKINIYTNVKLSEATQTNLDQKVSTIEVVAESASNVWGGADRKSHTMNFYHYDFGNIMTHNSEQNTFSGDLEMTFDIDDTPVPDILVDSQGNSHEKEFAYIGLSSVAVIDVTHGKMSNDMPTIQGITPDEDETRKLDAPKSDTEVMGFKIRPVLTMNDDPYISFGEALNFQSAGSSMRPTTKDGSDIWDPQEEKSMTDARIKFNVGRISPVVYEWRSRLDYNWYKYHHQEHWNFLWLGTHWTTSSSFEVKSLEKPSALHVINRYAQVEIKAVFEIYSCFTITAEESTMDNYALAKPEEYYDDLVWTSSVDGTTEGTVAKPADWNLFAGFGTGGWIMLIIIVIIAIIALVIVVKLARRKMGGGFTTWNNPSYMGGPPPGYYQGGPPPGYYQPEFRTRNSYDKDPYDRDSYDRDPYERDSRRRQSRDNKSYDENY